MDLLSQIGASLPLLLGLILVAVALLGLLLFVLFNRARDRAQYTDLEATGSPGTGGDPESSPELVDFRTSPAAADLRHSFARALRLLHRYLPGRASRYQLPWFMTFGQTAAGKTTALAFTELKLPFGEPDGGPGLSPCLWWIFDRGVVLDVAGDLALRLDGASSDQPSWLELLRLLRRHRARRPLDGLLLTVPATELLGVPPSDSQARNELAHRAELLRTRLDQAQRELRFDFPVYVLITQCDLLPGFADLAATVEPQQLQQIFGWSNPNAPDVPYSDAWVDDAFDSVGSALDEQQMRTLQANRPLAAPQGFLSLPAAVDSMRETLRIYWSQLFAGGDGALPVRGLYFSGGEGFDLPGSSHDDDYRTFGPTPPEGAHRRVDFVTDLFSYKVFYEWTLSRPEQKAWERRRRLRKALQVCLAAALLLGPLLIGWSGRRLAAAAGTVDRQFLVPAQRALQSDLTDPDRLEQGARALLAAISQVPDYRLRSVFLPPSWWSAYSRQVTPAGTRVYDRIVFPALSQNLAQQLSGVTASVPVTPPGARIYDVREVPEFLGLQGMTGQLGGVEANAGLYDRFAVGPCATGASDWLASFQKLVAGFDPSLRVQPPTYGAERYYRDVLCALGTGQGAPFTADPATTGRLQERALDLGGEASGSLFNGNVLVVDLDSLQSQLDALARQAPLPSQATQVYTDLLSTIDRTAKDLADPRVAWAGKATLDLGNPFESVLASIGRSPYLGLSTEQAIRRSFDAGFADFRLRLAGYSTQATGPLLAQKDGAVQLQLSTTIQGLRTALDSLLKDYSTTPQGPSLRLTPPAGTYLSWNAQGLTGAAALLASYTAFVNQSFKDYPGFQQIVDQSTRSGVEANVLSQVALAQNFPSLPGLTTRELREAHLQAQVANLSGASVPLNQLLQSFLKPPPVGGCPGAPGSAYCQLNGALLNQRASLLQQLDRLLTDQSLYAPVPGSLAGWDGQQNLAWSAFAVQNAAGLGGYLTSQRRMVTALNTQYATPILTAVPLGTAWGADSSDPYQRWTVIGSDLTDYENKAAGNAIQSLETFIGTDMAGATTANCLSLPSGSACFAPTTPAGLTANPPPCDYFLGAQASLQQGTSSRCAQLTASAAEAAYRAIEDAFDSRLEGRYPFASAATARGATPSDLRAFFAVYDAEKPIVDAFLKAGGQGAAWQRVRVFLTAMGQVRSFFAPFLDPPAPVKGAPASPAPTVPTYALQVDLRPAPQNEQGGDDIIVRTVQVGASSVATGGAPPASPILWGYGMQVQVSLRWALNSPTVPQAPPDETTAQLVDRTVTFTYGDPWSLLRLLQTHAAKPGDPPGTLLFKVPTVTQEPGAAGTAGEKPAPEGSVQINARIFLRIDLATPDGTQTPVSVPIFPTEAPPPGQ
jgi:type VI secretion system protein ImpL